MAIITLGVCVGFLPHNFNPARIFMGDSGALLLGLLMAVSARASSAAAPTRPAQTLPGQSYFFYAPLLVPHPDPRRADLRRAVRRSSAGPAGARAWRPPTRATSTTG